MASTQPLDHNAIMNFATTEVGGNQRKMTNKVVPKLNLAATAIQNDFEKTAPFFNPPQDIEEDLSPHQFISMSQVDHYMLPITQIKDKLSKRGGTPSDQTQV